jgi:hypothetical protein
MMVHMCVEIHAAKIRAANESTNILLNGYPGKQHLLYIRSNRTA